MGKKHECKFILGACICGATLVKRRFVTKAELLAEMTAPIEDTIKEDE